MANEAIQNLFELEYNKLDQAPVIRNLNILMASYEVFLHKLRVYHWNIVGQDYFNLRRKFHELYRKAFRNSDEIAERIRIFNHPPVTLLQDVIKLSRIKEKKQNLEGFEMVKDLLRDILVLISIMKDGMKAARNIDDGGTEAMIKSLLYEMEKDHRSLLSWLK